MIGFEIAYKENNETIDSSEPIFTLGDFDIFETIEFLKEPNQSIEISKNEYWGDESDYQFNDCFSRKEFTNVDDFKGYCEAQGLLTE